MGNTDYRKYIMGQFLKHLVQFIAVYSNCCSHAKHDWHRWLSDGTSEFLDFRSVDSRIFFHTLVIKKQLQGAECLHLKDGLGMLSFVSCNPSRFVDLSLVNHSDLLSPIPEFLYGPIERWGPSLLYSFVRILTNT